MGSEIKRFNSFFIPFTILCCSLSASSSFALPVEMCGLNFLHWNFILKCKLVLKSAGFYQVISHHPDPPPGLLLLAWARSCGVSPCCCSTLPFQFSWPSLLAPVEEPKLSVKPFNIKNGQDLMLMDLTMIASMHLVSMGNVGSSSSFPRLLHIFLKFIMSSGLTSSIQRPSLVALAVLPLRCTYVSDVLGTWYEQITLLEEQCSLHCCSYKPLPNIHLLSWFLL